MNLNSAVEGMFRRGLVRRTGRLEERQAGRFSNAAQMNGSNHPLVQAGISVTHHNGPSHARLIISLRFPTGWVYQMPLSLYHYSQIVDGEALSPVR